MIHIRRLLITVLTLTLLTGLSTAVALAQDPANGKVVFEEQVWQCQRCHGLTGEGLFGRPLAGSEKTAQEWIDQVRNPARFMPSFSAEQVSDQQIIDMNAYFTSLPKPANFTPQMPGPFDNPGQDLMAQKRCIACHTSEVETGQGNMINGLVERGVTPTTEVVLKQLRTPFKNMPSFRADQVSDDEAALIADYLAQAVAAQSAPAALPQSGGASPRVNPALWLLIGGALLLTGVVLYRRPRA
ncbi:MAG: cytochrome c [Chloroflexota bacterium]